jgi:hypothetical protein
MRAVGFWALRRGAKGLMRRIGRYCQVGHLALSASELLSGGASNAWPLRDTLSFYIYRPHS